MKSTANDFCEISAIESRDTMAMLISHCCITPGGVAQTGAWQFSDTSEDGLWGVWSGTWNGSNSSVLNLRSLSYTRTPINLIPAGAFYDMYAASPLQYPTVQSTTLGVASALLSTTEVAVYPGNPSSDPTNAAAVVAWTCGASGWYDITGTVRDAGVLNNGVTVVFTWYRALLPDTSSCSLGHE